ncbi:hypothetical protein E4K67_22610 [Desulfosporosinus fructosivorans]|uniref:Uncharacterized protein n=1 Tax=Desulfosporosinus fructosivorans TaxID=2018669 RepID=A0A4Z0QYN1_9FIRM|nr:hypothetical protein [Desulfosporosinus fructosivorans]TGE35911.1 hypothetical protein E4K67_22610 [Desulfosporosinus fructosivorans]
MNINTGHLITSEMFQELQPKDFMPLPEELESAAQKKLAGKPEAMVSLTSGGKLSKWASEQRRKKGKSGRGKMVKDSRRRNRHG